MRNPQQLCHLKYHVHREAVHFPTNQTALTSYRQEFLESSFPATHVSPTNEALASAAKGDEKELDREAKEGRLVEPKLNIKNTLIKFVLDQSIGAAVNTFAFSMFIHSIKMAMSGQPEHLASPDRSVSYLLSGKSIDYSRVDWIHVVAKSRAEFLSIMSAGTRLWPFVSLVNFAFVKSVEGRNLIGSLAGVGWGIYMSLLAARK